MDIRPLGIVRAEDIQRWKAQWARVEQEIAKLDQDDKENEDVAARVLEVLIPIACFSIGLGISIKGVRPQAVKPPGPSPPEGDIAEQRRS